MSTASSVTTHRHTDIHTHRQTDRQKNTQRQTDRERNSDSQTQIQTQTYRDRDICTTSVTTATCQASFKRKLKTFLFTKSFPEL